MVTCNVKLYFHSLFFRLDIQNEISIKNYIFFLCIKSHASRKGKLFRNVQKKFMTENNKRRCNSIEISEGTENILNSQVDTFRSCMHTHFIFVDILLFLNIITCF